MSKSNCFFIYVRPRAPATSRVIDGHRPERHAPPRVEAPEELVELQPQGLYADQDGFQYHYQYIAEHQPMTAANRVFPGLGPREGVDHEHHYHVADGVGAHSQEAQAVGHPAQQRLEEVEEPQADDHAQALARLMVAAYQRAQGLAEPDAEQHERQKHPVGRRCSSPVCPARACTRRRPPGPRGRARPVMPLAEKSALW